MWAICFAKCIKLRNQITFYAVNVLLIKMSEGKSWPQLCSGNREDNNAFPIPYAAFTNQGHVMIFMLII